MFVQIITGRLTDRAGMRAQLDRWHREIRPGARGFLGSTAGVAADGRFVALARFATAAEAATNSARDEQSRWWEQTAQYFDGSPTFRESDDVELLAAGGSDTARFVQVIEGRTTSRSEFMALERQLEHGGFMTDRPDFIGSTLVFWDDGGWVEGAYFTSEAEVRAGEARGLSPDVAAVFERWRAVAAPESYLDLTDPWLMS
jgi:hypothetical protein